eukprot:TRINITY_DN24355_c1_g4_i1.p1 TRINITY_DN24355_c1_g4~~TRINITY_DN24355_c1_g4_i1.p1  ORF type:complete len:295 (-),score=46.96 TRINITY_DN24355_c1_g4_i1:203-1087(-)
MEDYNELRKQFLSSQKALNADKSRRLLRLARDLKLSDSELIATVGSALLKQSISSLSEEELWLVQEQVAVAAMDCGAKKVAVQCVNAVVNRFSDSARAQRLRAMFYEFQGQFEAAEKIYKEILEKQPTNPMVNKRLVALLKSQGKITNSIEELAKYLETNPSDKEGWEELADLYVKQGAFKQAGYCFEELIMLAPHFANYYIRYADSLYSIGGSENFNLAKKYYCKSITLSAGKSLRALMGLSLCLNQESGKNKDEELQELIQSNVELLFKKSQNSDKLEAVLQVISELCSGKQ